MKKFKGLTLVLSISIILISCLSGCSNNDYTDTNDKKVSTKSVTVTLDANGGLGVTQITLIGIPGNAMNLPNPTREGFTFDKWYDGWDIIDNTVFPENDTTFTARYYVNEDIPCTIEHTTELNKEYKDASSFRGAEIGITWNNTHLDAKKIEYLTKNPLTDILIELTFEYYTSIDGVKFQLQGASKADVLATSGKLTSKQYTETVLSVTTQSKVMVGSSGYFFRLYGESTLGSTTISARNLNMTIAFNMTAGTLA